MRWQHDVLVTLQFINLPSKTPVTRSMPIRYTDNIQTLQTRIDS